MSQSKVETFIRREQQLHALSYVVILALTGLAGVLTSAVLKGLGVADVWLFDSYYFRVLFPGLLVAVVLYMADQHRRLSGQLSDAHEALASAAEELQASVQRLEFAYGVAEAMASLTADSAVHKTLAQALDRFQADVAAIVGDDLTIVPSEEACPQHATRAIMSAAVEAVRAGKPCADGDETTGFALAVPLRVSERLDSVVALWRSSSPFDEEDAATLSLASHLVGLGLENRELLEEANRRLRGLVTTLATLVADRVPGYREHAASVADLAVNVGLALGLSRDEITTLREAASLLDVGMVAVPAEILAAPRPLTPQERELVQRHPIEGQRLLEEAGFDRAVAAAVRHHHERLDGSGYPDHLRGDDLSLTARILGACDTFVALTSPRAHRPASLPAAALAVLEAETGVKFDARVVAALRQVLGLDGSRLTASDAGRLAELLEAAQ